MEQRNVSKLLAMSVAMTLVSGCAVQGGPFSGEAALVKCQGINQCKGTSECASQNNHCKALNKCKGQGWQAATVENCKMKKGSVLGQKT